MMGFYRMWMEMYAEEDLQTQILLVSTPSLQA